MTSPSEQLNECTVKYIHLKTVDPDRMQCHALADYELQSTLIRHSSYEDLHEQVFTKCPTGYVCTEPLALYHELLWSRGLSVRRDDSAGPAVVERDVLHHAIELGEYDLFWGTAENPVKTICVDVEPEQVTTQSPLAQTQHQLISEG